MHRSIPIFWDCYWYCYTKNMCLGDQEYDKKIYNFFFSRKTNRKSGEGIYRRIEKTETWVLMAWLRSSDRRKSKKSSRVREGR